MNEEYNIIAFGENVALLRCEERISLNILDWLYGLNTILNTKYVDFVRETVVTYNELAVVYNCHAYSFEEIKKVIQTACDKVYVSYKRNESREIEVPICYDEEFAPDKGKLEMETGLSFDSIVEKHSMNQYVVYMMGFLPGFLYLGELPAELGCSRLENPRKRVPKGSVGIAGNQTGIYPSESPGGWNLIGKTPIELLKIKDGNLSPFKPLDRITFLPISKREYDSFDATEYFNSTFK